MGNDNKPATSLVDLVIEAMPFSDELIDWCVKYPEFKEALKFANASNFMPLGMVITSRPDSRPDDEVIGFITYDMNKKFFKQDFIVNVGKKGDEFILYTKLPNKRYGRYVRHINEFKAIYGIGGSYAKTHHLTLEDLDAMNNPLLYERSRRAIELSELIARYGMNKHSEELLNDILGKIRAEKAIGEHVEWSKLPKGL